MLKIVLQCCSHHSALKGLHQVAARYCMQPRQCCQHFDLAQLMRVRSTHLLKLLCSHARGSERPSDDCEV